MLDVKATPQNYSQNALLEYADSVKPDRTPEDLLIQSMLRLGVLLSSKIEVETIGGKRVFNVADDYLIACFDEGITKEVVETIANRKPTFAVFRDRDMKDDATLANFDQVFERLSPETTRRVL